MSFIICCQIWTLYINNTSLISYFCRVQYVVCFLLGNFWFSSGFWPAIPWPTLTRATSLSHTSSRPPTWVIKLSPLVFKQTHPYPVTLLSNRLKLFLSQTLSHMDSPTIPQIQSLFNFLSMKMEQSVPKRRHIKFRRRGITQKKTYNK
jgi:hypothetical protein